MSRTARHAATPARAPAPAGLTPKIVTRRRRFRWRIALGVTIGIVVLMGLGLRVVDEPLRRQLEARVNAALDGYSVSIGRVAVHPLGLALDLYDVTMQQDALPDSPVAYLPRWTTSVQWTALLSGALVADMRFDRPQLYLTFAQAAEEARDPVPAEERGWQDAVTAIYPLKINDFRVVDGDVTYFDSGPLGPLHFERIAFRAENIRNVRSTAGRYPSPLEFHARLAGAGPVALRGRADLLAEPHAAMRATFDLRDLALVRFVPVAQHYGVAIGGGTMAARGRLEYAPWRKRVTVARVDASNVSVDYVVRAGSAAEDTQRAQKVVRAAATAKDAPDMQVDVKEVRLAHGLLGFSDEVTGEGFRLLVADTTLTVHDFSNRRSARRGTAHLEGRFMHSGALRVDSSFASGATRPDFTAKVQLEAADLRTLNDLLRATGGFDVARGQLSLYSEMRASGGRVDGYVKPLFADVDVYDARQDAEKGMLKKLYEAAVGGAATVLSNRARGEVATVADLSGPIENANASTLDVILGLLRNAFIKAILPGLERGR